MTEIKNQSAIITGASSGIGKAIAHHLASEGANVVLVARRAERLNELAEEVVGQYGGEAKVVETDLTKREDVENLVEQTKSSFVHVDILYRSSLIDGDGKRIVKIWCACNECTTRSSRYRTYGTYYRWRCD